MPWRIQRYSYVWRADGNHRDLTLQDTWENCRIKMWYEMEDIYLTASAADGKVIFDRDSTGYCGSAVITTRRRWIELPGHGEQGEGSCILCTLEAGI